MYKKTPEKRVWVLFNWEERKKKKMINQGFPKSGVIVKILRSVMVLKEVGGWGRGEGRKTIEEGHD